MKLQTGFLLLLTGFAGCAANSGGGGQNADDSNSVYIYGYVARPGRYTLKSGHTMSLDIISDAGGASTGGDAVVDITHVIFPNRLDQKTSFSSINALKTRPDADVVLQPHDVIYVH